MNQIQAKIRIRNLERNRIPESDILDYKVSAIGDQDLIKHTSLFANTGGGHLIFGVRESGRGGYPVAIPGLDNHPNVERMEQIILSNVQPRLHVGFKVIQVRSRKVVLILEIPNSQYKPHQNALNRKFYKRFEFEAAEMTEAEISETYKERFSVRETVDDYLNQDYLSELGDADVSTSIAVIPSFGNQRLKIRHDGSF